MFFEWFRNREDLENELFRSAHTEGRLYDGDPQLNAVRAAIHAMMPGFSSPQVKRQPSLHMVIKKGDEKFKIQDLSDGEKCLLALVGDMARRIAMANPSAPNPLEAEAVFLIDEIELHLHPAWQRMIVPRLLEVFPNSQFFVTTHSPQVLGEVKDTDSIWIMKPGEQPYHPGQSSGRLVIEPSARKKYSLQELLAQCDASAPFSEEDAVWTASVARGRELI